MVQYAGLVIGRFQLVGNHHVDLFTQIEEYHRDRCALDALYVGVASKVARDNHNPFDAKECQRMIEPVAREAASRMGIPVYFARIEDIADDTAYAQHVQSHLGYVVDEGHHIIVFSGNPWTLSCFEGPYYHHYEARERVGMHATNLRDLYVKGEDIRHLVPPHTMRLLEQVDMAERLRHVDGH